MRPETGGRVVLERSNATTEIEYQAGLYTPDAEWHGVARVPTDGQIVLESWQPAEPPAWLVELARVFLRSEWRGRQGPEPAPWPARINRWRAQP